MSKIFIYGAGGHGLVVADIAKSNGFEEIVFIDDSDNNFQTFDEIKFDNKTPIALGIGSNKIRRVIFEKVKKYNFKILTLIHPSSIISSSVLIGEGTVVMPNVVVNANTIIGKACILNTSCVIEHENNISDFVHISPSVSCAGNVKIDENTHLGINSCVIQGVNIGSNTLIGAGSVVTKNINDYKKAYGIPCKEIEDIN